MKNFLIFLLTNCFALTLSAQNFTVSGIVTDADGKTPLIGTHLTLTNSSNAAELTSISDFDGSFIFENVPNGSFDLKISYIGYENFSREVLVNGNNVNLPKIALKEGVELAEVQVVEQVLPVIQLEDTTQFNASAYKTMPDATAEDLIEKMPTVVIDNGTVQAQGEDVKQVLVDGKPFFGNDPKAALRNLPAEVIDKIQIFDEKSDQAKFTGFDDGETSKTINIITKKDMRSGQFGKIYAGYGYEDKYQAGGNINYFNGDQRISVIGLTNNINEQNFSTEDLLGVVGSAGNERRGGGGGGGGGRRGGGPPGREQNIGASSNDFLVSQQGGITSSNAFGINFSDEWGEKVDVSASYFFNESDNTTEQLLTQQYFDAEGLTEMYDEESLTESTNLNHRFSAALKYKINEKNTLIWRPNLKWQSNEGSETVFGQTLLNSEVLNETDSDYSADLSALNVSNSLLWQHKFAKPRRTFSLNVTNGFAPEKGNSDLSSTNIFGTETTISDQNSTLDKSQWTLSANAQYTEPIGEKSMLLLDYKANYQQEDSEIETFDFNESSQDYDLLNNDLSSVFSNDYFSQSLGGGLAYRAGNWRLMGRFGVQNAELLTEQTLPYQSDTKHTFLNVLPTAMVSFRASKTEDLRLGYRTNTSLPTITQLQNVLDNSNPLQLSIGNPDLVQGYQHRLFGRYSKTNTEKSSVFFAMLSGSMTNDYIATSTYLSAADYDENLEEDAQISVPVNLDGYYDLRSFATYGFPISRLKSNLNINLSGNYSRTPGLVNEALNYADNTTAGAGLTFSSNISERLDFTLSTRSSYNFSHNTLQSASDNNYYNQNTRFKFNLLLWDDLIFRTDITHEFYSGLSDDFNQNYLLWNMSLGKKLFKDNRGEISLTVFDLLSQNNSLTRNVTESYTEDVQTNVLQQYVMLSFKYDLRHFKVGS